MTTPSPTALRELAERFDAEFAFTSSVCDEATNALYAYARLVERLQGGATVEDVISAIGECPPGYTDGELISAAFRAVLSENDNG